MSLCHNCGGDPAGPVCLVCGMQGRDAAPSPPSLPPAAEGVKHDGGKPRLDLLPFDALEEVGKVLDYGAKKYAPHNWAKGMAWGRMLAACLRHLAAWARGVEVDPESGLHHLSHAACCALMLLALVLRKAGTDDRAVSP